MNLPLLILASASPRRAELLRQLELKFEIIPSEAEEIHHDYLTAGELCQINAYRKARLISKKFPDALVLGVDTLVALEKTVFGKPKTKTEAQEMLERFQGKTHQAVTGVCLIHLRSHHQKVFVEHTEVTFHPLSAPEIRHYLSRINPLDKAGAYAIQEHGGMVVRKISGSFSNVMGLPLERLKIELANFTTKES